MCSIFAEIRRPPLLPARTTRRAAGQSCSAPPQSRNFRWLSPCTFVAPLRLIPRQGHHLRASYTCSVSSQGKTRTPVQIACRTGRQSAAAQRPSTCPPARWSISCWTSATVVQRGHCRQNTSSTCLFLRLRNKRTNFSNTVAAGGNCRAGRVQASHQLANHQDFSLNHETQLQPTFISQM